MGAFREREHSGVCYVWRHARTGVDETWGTNHQFHLICVALKIIKSLSRKEKKQISDNLPIYFLRQGVGARFAVLFPKYRVRLDTGCRQSWSVDWVEIGGTTNHQSANRHRHPICQIRNPDLPPSLCINPVHPRTISISGRWALTSRSPIRSVRSKAAKQQIMGGLPCVLFPRISNW